MNVLITGNMGYVGPVLVRHLRLTYPKAIISGFDAGFFSNCLTEPLIAPEAVLNRQYFGDVRDLPDECLRGVDAVVHLAAISNDPMGKAFEELTMQVNHLASVETARRAKAAGVKHFVFASSCSVYGFAEDGARTEASSVNPLTAYARSKVAAESGLKELADDAFRVTCLRFATACGWSPRLRLDLVLNDFVAGAIATKQINILSDGTPWRPLIDVHDMARALEWGATRDSGGGAYLVVNAGSNHWNYQVKDLAAAVQKGVPGVQVSINPNSQPDKRSYRVDFSLFERLAPNHQPLHQLADSIRDLQAGLESMQFSDANFRKSRFIRLEMLDRLRTHNSITHDLRWNPTEV
jgi:nucleoside-diphosphate-sugar epimerase